HSLRRHPLSNRTFEFACSANVNILIIEQAQRDTNPQPSGFPPHIGAGMSLCPCQPHAWSTNWSQGDIHEELTQTWYWPTADRHSVIRSALGGTSVSNNQRFWPGFSPDCWHHSGGNWHRADHRVNGWSHARQTKH